MYNNVYAYAYMCIFVGGGTRIPILFVFFTTLTVIVLSLVPIKVAFVMILLVFFTTLTVIVLVHIEVTFVICS